MNARVTLPEHFDELIHHGGNINAARSRFPDAPLPWIDLSTGINPLPYPIGLVARDAWTRLPEPAAQAALEASARLAFGASQSAAVVAAPGTQALLQLLPRVFPARRIGVLGFTYAEHEKCWREAGADVVTVDTIDALAGFEVGVVVNPNNPDGRIVQPDLLAGVAEALGRRGGLLIVDEAFMDTGDPADSLVPYLPCHGAVVLRSFGKTYGLAGLRLGFAVASAFHGAALRAALGPWSVSGPAIEIGQRALSDTGWLSETRCRLRVAADRMDGLLRPAGFKIAGGTELFRLAVHPEAAMRFERLGRAGILTRPFEARPEWLRFGLPGEPREWARLQAALLHAV